MSVDKTNIRPEFAALFKDTFGFTNEEYDLFLSAFTTKRVKKKEFVLKAGQVCNFKAYVNSGCARNFLVDEQGRERILYFSFEDWWLGDFESYYSGTPGTNYIQTLEDCELLHVSKEDFLAMERKIPALAKWYSYKMARSASAVHKRMGEIRLFSPEERYKELIDKHPSVFQRIPLQHIASYLGIEPQSLSRMRKRMLRG